MCTAVRERGPNLSMKLFAIIESYFANFTASLMLEVLQLSFAFYFFLNGSNLISKNQTSLTQFFIINLVIKYVMVKTCCNRETN